MVYESKYKDRPGVTIESERLIAVFLPQDGGKMASLRVKDTNQELLAVKPEECYKALTYDGSYVDAECSGFDDMFPTVDPYTPPAGPFAGCTYPDHGEICRISHVVSGAEDEILLKGTSRLFPLEYEKKIAPTEDGELRITYTIHNRGIHPFPYLWAGHIMLQGKDGMRVFTPFDGEPVSTEMMFASKGTKETLPADHLTGYEPGEGATYKFYYLEPMQKGCFGLCYPDGSRLTFRVDENKIPYLGIWLNNGAFQDLYSITPEPCTVPFDSPGRAKERGYTSVIPGGSSFCFDLLIGWMSPQVV